jgi:hypothetical protein
VLPPTINGKRAETTRQHIPDPGKAKIYIDIDDIIFNSFSKQFSPGNVNMGEAIRGVQTISELGSRGAAPRNSLVRVPGKWLAILAGRGMVWAASGSVG